MKLKLLALIFTLVLATPAFGYPAVCSKVLDGDTIVVHAVGLPEGCNDVRYYRHIRLAAIDCPEKDQPMGREATSYTAAACMYRTIYIVPITDDRYGRQVAWVFLLPPTPAPCETWMESCVNVQLVRMGLAWHYRQYDHAKTEFHILDLLQLNAMHTHIGIWQYKDTPIAPWVWRRHAK